MSGCYGLDPDSGTAWATTDGESCIWAFRTYHGWDYYENESAARADGYSYGKLMQSVNTCVNDKCHKGCVTRRFYELCY